MAQPSRLSVTLQDLVSGWRSPRWWTAKFGTFGLGVFVDRVMGIANDRIDDSSPHLKAFLGFLSAPSLVEWVLIVFVIYLMIIITHSYAETVRISSEALDITASVGNITWSPVSQGQGMREWIVRVNDLLLSSREAQPLHLQSQLWIKAKAGGSRPLQASIPCRSGITTMQTEVGEPPHLPTEVTLLPDGSPQRGHIDFVGLYTDDEWAGQAMEGVELELIDIRSGRSLRKTL